MGGDGAQPAPDALAALTAWGADGRPIRGGDRPHGRRQPRGAAADRARRLTAPAGNGGLSYPAPGGRPVRRHAARAVGSGAAPASLRDRQPRDRIGWNELVVTAAPGVERVRQLGVRRCRDRRAAQLSGLGAGRRRSTNVPRRCRSASARRPPERRRWPGGDGTAAVRSRDRFAELIAVPELTPARRCSGVLVAALLGGLHALSPGHGKTVVGAYLVGSRGTARHAAFLGLTVTVTHTLGVFALGLVTLFASHYVLPERLYPDPQRRLGRDRHGRSASACSSPALRAAWAAPQRPRPSPTPSA